MERKVAIAKLGKLIGKSLGYRVDPTAPSADERNEVKAQIRELVAAKVAAEKAMTDRKMELLRGDAQYQELKATYHAARERSAAAFSLTHHYRFTVGKSTGMFFHVLAQGDSWEEVIDIVSRKG